MGFETKIEFFKRNGYVNFGNDLLSSAVIDELANLCGNTYTKMDKSDPSFFSGGLEGYRNILGKDIKIAEFINRIFSNSSMKLFLKETLGDNFKIMDISFRRSPPGDAGLFLHQDGIGQLNMAISLDENNSKNGATAVLPGSHLLSRSLNSLGIIFHALQVNTLGFLFEPLSGPKGTIFMMSNRIWHGRYSNSSNLSHDVIFVSLYPRGYRLYEDALPDYLTRLESAPDLSRLIGTSIDVKNSKLVSKASLRDCGEIYYHPDHAYLMEIERKEFLMNAKISSLLLIKVLFISYTSKICNTLLRLFKAVNTFFSNNN